MTPRLRAFSAVAPPSSNRHHRAMVAGLRRVLTRVRKASVHFVRQRFPILHGHPGESEAFRRRLQSAVALLLGYRVLAATTALLLFVDRGAQLSNRPEAVVALGLLYIGLSLIMFWWTSNLELRVKMPRWLGGADGSVQRVAIGAGHRGWLDRRRALETDLVIAVALNVALAALLDRGDVYEQAADAFGISLITTTVLWTGRRGGRVGVRLLALVVATEVVKAPVNGMPMSDVDWVAVGTRAGWAVCGWVIAIGIIRILLDYAERTERLRIEDEHLMQVGRSHDTYKAALMRIADSLAQSEEGIAVEVRRLAVEATHEVIPQADAPHSLRAIADWAAQRGRAANPAMTFLVVDGSHGGIGVEEPQRLLHALENLTINAARHSRGRRTVIRCGQRDDGWIEITVWDDGVGMSSDHGTRSGIGLVRRAAEQYGGDAFREHTPKGTKWVLRIPPSGARAVEAAR